jgi:O-antigen/teichoic acid export membrane protein
MLFAVPFSFASAILTPIVFLLGKEHRYVALSLAASAIGTLILLVGSAIQGSEGAAIGFTARQLLLALVLVILIQVRRESRVGGVSVAL